MSRTLGHPLAVSTTLENIERNYVVVGVLEMLEETVTVLECLMPEMMTGLVDAHKSSNVHKKGSHKPMSAAVMSLETREMMRSRLEPEYQVYNFVKQRLQAQYQHCLVNRAS